MVSTLESPPTPFDLWKWNWLWKAVVHWFIVLIFRTSFLEEGANFHATYIEPTPIIYLPYFLPAFPPPLLSNLLDDGGCTMKCEKIIILTLIVTQHIILRDAVVFIVLGAGWMRMAVLLRKIMCKQLQPRVKCEAIYKVARMASSEKKSTLPEKERTV